MRVAVIGAAGSAGQRHCRAFHEEGCDIWELEKGYPPFSFNQIPFHVDIVSIATPDDLHAAMVCHALGEHRHVFCEKPLAHNEFSLARIERAMNNSRGTLGCNLPLRYAKGLKSFDLENLLSLTGSYRWGRNEKMRGWRGQIPDYSIICGGGIHLVDLMMLMTGQKPSDILTSSHSKLTKVSSFRLGSVHCRLIVDFQDLGPHRVNLTVDLRREVQHIPFDEPNDFRAPIHDFLCSIQSGGQGNGREALAANRACLAIEEAAR